jgi:hypothetical protein
MYNTEVVCTYNTNDIFLETDKLSERDKGFISDAIYRQELLNILCIEDYNGIELDNAIVDLYEKIKSCEELQKYIKKLANDFSSSDNILGLMLLFSYDYMYLTHICVSEFLNTGNISKTNIFNLESLLFTK